MNQFGKPSGSILGNQITSFMTPLNPLGKGHDCIRVTNPSTAANFVSSIFYGGAVKVPAGAKDFVRNNAQFRTTGNTTYLSSKQIDLRFQQNVGRYGNNTSIAKLAQIDFTLRPESPVPSNGSYLRVLAQLLSFPIH